MGSICTNNYDKQEGTQTVDTHKNSVQFQVTLGEVCSVSLILVRELRTLPAAPILEPLRDNRIQEYPALRPDQGLHQRRGQDHRDNHEHAQSLLQSSRDQELPVQEAPHLRPAAIQNGGLAVVPAAIQKRDKVDAVEHKVDDHRVHEHGGGDPDAAQPAAAVRDAAGAARPEDRLQAAPDHRLEEDDEHVQVRAAQDRGLLLPQHQLMIISLYAYQTERRKNHQNSTYQIYSVIFYSYSRFPYRPKVCEPFWSEKRSSISLWMLKDQRWFEGCRMGEGGAQSWQDASLSGVWMFFLVLRPAVLLHFSLKCSRVLEVEVRLNFFLVTLIQFGLSLKDALRSLESENKPDIFFMFGTRCFTSNYLIVTLLLSSVCRNWLAFPCYKSCTDLQAFNRRLVPNSLGSNDSLDQLGWYHTSLLALTAVWLPLASWLLHSSIAVISSIVSTLFTLSQSLSQPSTIARKAITNSLSPTDPSPRGISQELEKTSSLIHAQTRLPSMKIIPTVGRKNPKRRVRAAKLLKILSS